MLRACCSIQAVFGLLVEARYSTRRVPTERKTSTYRRRNQTVSTVKKSQARDRVRMRLQEAAPRLRVAPRRRRHASLAQDVADRGRRDGDT
jgi:hypothetical protein